MGLETDKNRKKLQRAMGLVLLVMPLLQIQLCFDTDHDGYTVGRCYGTYISNLL